jgi:hypothetical protein
MDEEHAVRALFPTNTNNSPQANNPGNLRFTSMAKREHTSGLANPRRAPHALTSEALARPVGNASTTPLGATALRTSIYKHSPQRPHCAMPTRLTNEDATPKEVLHEIK